MAEPVAGGITTLALQTIKYNRVTNTIPDHKWSVDSVSFPEREADIICPANDDNAITGTECRT